MNKYCCFNCPQKDYSEKEITDQCPICGYEYGFMLKYKPGIIGDYKIIHAIDRGFYGATYIAESTGLVKKKFVLKISPKTFYSFFDKTPFDEEVALHNNLTESGTPYIVGIISAFEHRVVFSDSKNTNIECYVIVLDYVKGYALEDYLSGQVDISINIVCQIALDLLAIRSEFERHNLNHNDLHAGNIMVEELSYEAQRADAFARHIRLKAIDLGSVADESKSGQSRDGDLLFMAEHLETLLQQLLQNPDSLDDKDYRAAFAVQALIQGLIVNAQNARLPDPQDFITTLKEVYWGARQQWRPWNQPLVLKGFGDHYNAQTLSSWHVPRLLVDPDGLWLKELSKPGPQIMTGMRGCGKTMLLRALDFHARASSRDEDTPAAIKSRIMEDNFIGLFVRAQRLLELRTPTPTKIEYHIAKLFICYSLEATRVLIHLSDIDRDSLHPDAHKKISNVVADCLNGSDSILTTSSLDDLESRLERMLVLAIKANRDSPYIVDSSAENIFIRLAEELKKCSPILSDSYILFLLDDVSTRYLKIEQIYPLISSLLFQSDICAFKFTSEWQTIELGLRSPGRNHPIMVGRDIEEFDLGENVFRTIKTKGNKFVADILKQRASVYANNLQNHDPARVLGDVSLEEVAKDIASSSSTSAKRKNVYRGLSCLTKVCVGDIGDVIKLYEDMLIRTENRTSLPIPKNIQSECFQTLSSRRLYDLNRRKGFFKDHALQFAQASHELLVRSYREMAENPTAKNLRLRQFSSIYVRITAEDAESSKEQIDTLRELIDAGVFVYTGGNPRSKTRDSNPTRQFKLTYRKIYGLASYIGLSDRDRFELSGTELEMWLHNPDQAKEILLRNQISTDFSIDDDEEMVSDVEIKKDENEKIKQIASQLSLFTTSTPDESGVILESSLGIKVAKLTQKAFSNIPITTIIAGLGFEERTLEACKRLSNIISPCSVVAIRYNLEGKAPDILARWEKKGFSVNTLNYEPSKYKIPTTDGPVLIDITGLSKPLIFSAVKSELSEKGVVYISHATAKRHYPLQEAINEILTAKENDNTQIYLEKLSNTLMGESGPYALIPLLDDNSDPSRNRSLLAFSSAKHERLFSLLEDRDYDSIEIISSKAAEPRSKIATLAAEFLCESYQNATVSYFDSSDLQGLLTHLDSQYLKNYGIAGSNLEIGLTGSKLQAVASAVLSSRRKIAQSWYISPKEFDATRFTEGFDKLSLYKISRMNIQ